MEELKKYFKQVIGIEVEIKPVLLNKLNSLPLYITIGYDLFLTNINNQDFILAEVKNEFTADTLRKHFDIIQTTLNLPTAAVIKPIEAYNRLRLIEKRIPFIIPGKQMYLPDLLIDLKEFKIKPKEQIPFMPPAAQLLILFHLQIELLEGINLKSIAKKLGYDAMTITRSVHYLQNADLCQLLGTKDKFLHFGKNKSELWELALPLMTSPVKKTIFYTGKLDDHNFRKANMSALSFYSNLNPDRIEYYAVKYGYLQNLIENDQNNFGQFEGNICFEEWKYDPTLLTKTQYVDPLSIYLCFRNNDDERTQMALEQIIKNMLW
ncbi:MAG: hypothetical protein HXX09_10730 [Bacteroidetes bacterium]|nr:hypothetical protein [Bacteroidota bacterium]